MSNFDESWAFPTARINPRSALEYNGPNRQHRGPDCPQCGAPSGAYCMTKSGLPREAHQGRVNRDLLARMLIK